MPRRNVEVIYLRVGALLTSAKVVRLDHPRPQDEYAQINPTRQRVIQRIFVIVIGFARLCSGNG